MVIFQISRKVILNGKPIQKNFISRYQLRGQISVADTYTYNQM